MAATALSQTSPALLGHKKWRPSFNQSASNVAIFCSRSTISLSSRKSTLSSFFKQLEIFCLSQGHSWLHQLWRPCPIHTASKSLVESISYGHWEAPAEAPNGGFGGSGLHLRKGAKRRKGAKKGSRIFYRPVQMPATIPPKEPTADSNDASDEEDSFAGIAQADTTSLSRGATVLSYDESRDSVSDRATSPDGPQRIKSPSRWWKKNFGAGKSPRLKLLATPATKLGPSNENPSESFSELRNSIEGAVDASSMCPEEGPSGSAEEGDLFRNDYSRRRESIFNSLETAPEKEAAPSVSGRAEIQPGSRKAWFPHSGLFEIQGEEVDAAFVRRALEAELAPKRIDRIAEVVAGRSYAVVPVVEGLKNLDNVAAVCRTAEALGCQSVHAIAEENAKYKASGRVSAGSDKWLDLELWLDTEECLRTLKGRGYRVAVTCMDQLGAGVETRPIHEIDWTIPTAVVLGNEMFGVTEKAKAMADIGCYIPMGGFTDSFNISHAAAIMMYHAVRDRITKQGFHADLTPEQRDILTAEFYLRCNRSAKSVVHRLLEVEGAMLNKAPKSFVRSLVDRQKAIQLAREE